VFGLGGSCLFLYEKKLYEEEEKEKKKKKKKMEKTIK
jgi:hypothetical protein